MKQITRQQAERMIKKASVVTSQIEQDQEQLKVLIKLANNHACLVTYNLQNQEKLYFDAISC